MIRQVCVVAVVAGAASWSAGQVTSFSSRAAFDGAFPGALREDFSAFSSGSLGGTSLSTAGMTLTTQNPASPVDESLEIAGFQAQFLQLTRRGSGTVGFADFGSGPIVLRVDFDQAVNAFGIDINGGTLAAGDVEIRALDGRVVASSVGDRDPSINVSDFAGFSSDEFFSSLLVVNTSRFQAVAYDGFRFVVPAPGVCGVMALGGVVVGRRRRG